MSKILKKIDQLADAECSVLMQGNRPLGSTFPKDKIIYIKIALQSFGHIFKQADHLSPGYDEAHMQLSKQRLLCFRIGNGTYISLLKKGSDVQKAQRVIRGARETLLTLLKE